MKLRVVYPQCLRCNAYIVAAVCLLISLAVPRDGSGESIRRTPIVGIVEKVAPAVVNISAEAIVRAPDRFLEIFSRRDGASSRSALALSSSPTA
jgi:S1-C subfamily serine protease